MMLLLLRLYSKKLELGESHPGFSSFVCICICVCHVEFETPDAGAERTIVDPFAFATS
ncbi:hypothetical protein HanIR_Chr05g0215051 [Helianthus annuus]|nr:hypothetical protein HanIR_Chr05g0215051 [Helianthus annuus]